MGGGDGAVMVTRRLLILAFVALCLPLAAAGQAWASGNYAVKSSYSVTIDALGTAHVVDVWTYDEELFRDAVDEFTDHPSLLSRDNRQEILMGKYRDFRHTIDAKDHTVTMTWNEPGYAYDRGDHWEVWLSADAPDKLSGREAVWTDTDADYSSARTYWYTTDLSTTTHMKLPAAATGAKWDDGRQRLVYDLAYVPPAPPRNLLQRNQLPFALGFGLIAAASLAGIVVVLRRARRRPVAALAGAAPVGSLEAATVLSIPAWPARREVGPPPGMLGLPGVGAGGPGAPGGASLMAAETPPAEAPQVPLPQETTRIEAPTVPAAEEMTRIEAHTAPAAEEQASFCSACGHPLAAGDHFCTSCGKRLA
jgi:hypothetical protein